jgi:anti-sigma-K factor RskA
MTTDTSVLSEKDSLLAAEFALGVLQGDARQAFGRRIEQEAALAAAVRHWDEHFVSFADDIAMVQPPRSIEAALEQRLFTSASSSKPSIWNSLSFWRGLAIASVAAVVALGAWNLRPAVEVAGAGLVAEVAGESNTVKLVAYYNEAKGELRLNRTQGSVLAGRSFELWLIAGQDAPVSLGLLPAEANGSFVVPVSLRSKLKGGTLAISDEPQGGSTTGAPTGAVLATGQLTII